MITKSHRSSSELQCDCLSRSAHEVPTLHAQLPGSDGELAGLVILVEGADLTLSADWESKGRQLEPVAAALSWRRRYTECHGQGAVGRSDGKPQQLVPLTLFVCMVLSISAGLDVRAITGAGSCEVPGSHETCAVQW